MQIKPIFTLTVLCSLFLGACSTTPTSQVKANKQPAVLEPIVYTEPQVSAPYYALNPADYTSPPEFEVNLQKSINAPLTKLRVKADPNNPNSEEIILDKNRFIIPINNSNDKALKFAALAQDNELDVTEIDDFLTILEGKARHYPTRFDVKREKTGMTDKLKSIISTLDRYAVMPNASYDILLRAAKASHMARNLDMGETYGPKALSYATRLLKMKPNDPETSFWLGFGLSEGGAFKEATPYLKTAMEADIQEAHLSMANNYLSMEQKKNAITTLKNYKVKYPSEGEIVDQLVTEIEADALYNVWQRSR